MTRDKDSETTQVTHAGSRADDDDDDRCPSAECGLVGSATLARDLEREEVHESVPLERALLLEESGGPCGAAQPAQSPRAEWSTIPTPTFETLVVGSAVANDAMGAPENTRLRVRPCPNPWSTTEREQHVARLPKDGVIEHRAIVAPKTPPRKYRKLQEELVPTKGKGSAPGDTSPEAATDVGAAGSAKINRPYSEVSAEARALLTQRMSSGAAPNRCGALQPAAAGQCMLTVRVAELLAGLEDRGCFGCPGQRLDHDVVETLARMESDDAEWILVQFETRLSDERSCRSAEALAEFIDKLLEDNDI